ncbi:MAG: M42 family peptidase [Haloplanus sp.]
MILEPERRDFLDRLLKTPSPSGFETRGQRVWIDYVESFADDVWTDDYGNAVAVHEGGERELALTGHADEIGFIVRRIDDDGFVRIGAIGGSDRTVSKGQHVTVHADEPVSGVVGQTAIHLRETGEETYDDIGEQYVDVGATDGDEAESLVSVGDPVTFSTTVEDLHGSRIAARGLDNRIGVWAAAEGLRRAVAADVDATVYAVSTIQEEVGLQGARMVGFDLAPDAVVAVDVTHATDSPGVPDKKRSPVELGDGPVIARGSANHPVLVDLARTVAEAEDVDVQLQAAGSRTGTDADAFYTSAGGTPSLNVGLPNRYMHTPVEVIDETDLADVATLLGAMADRAGGVEGFAVEV